MLGDVLSSTSRTLLRNFQQRKNNRSFRKPEGQLALSLRLRRPLRVETRKHKLGVGRLLAERRGPANVLVWVVEAPEGALAALAHAGGLAQHGIDQDAQLPVRLAEGLGLASVHVKLQALRTRLGVSSHLVRLDDLLDAFAVEEVELAVTLVDHMPHRAAAPIGLGFAHCGVVVSPEVQGLILCVLGVAPLAAFIGLPPDNADSVHSMDLLDHRRAVWHQPILCVQTINLYILWWLMGGRVASNISEGNC